MYDAIQSHIGYPVLFRKKGVVCHPQNNLYNFLYVDTEIYIHEQASQNKLQLV